MTPRRTLLLALVVAGLAVALALGLPRVTEPAGSDRPGVEVPGSPGADGDSRAAAATEDDSAPAPEADATAGADPVRVLAQAADPEDVPGSERFRAHARAVADDDVEALGELMTGDDYPALRAAHDLAARQDLPAETRLAALERVLALRIDEPLAHEETRSLRLALAATAEAAERPDRALREYRRALPAAAAVDGVERLVEDPYRRANIFLQAGMDARALDALDGRSAPSIEAPALRDLGRHEEALEAYERWSDEVPDDLDARYGVAWSHWYLGDMDAADAAFEALPGTGALYGRGLVANRRGELDRAVAFLRATGEPARLWLATTLLEREGRYRDAAKAYLEIAAVGESDLADDAAWRARVIGLREEDPTIVEAAEAALPEGSYFTLRSGGDPLLPTRNDLEPARPEAVRTAAWLAEVGDRDGARGALAFALRDAATEAEIVELGEALAALREYRIPQRAAAALVAGGSDQFRTWRLAYPRAWPRRVTEAAERAGVDPELAWAVMRRESAFYPDAISRSGAQGLMQVMPATWDWIAELQDEPPADAFDPSDNIRYGVHYLGWLSDYFDGDLELVVPSYNRGQGYIRRLFEGDEVAGDMDELLRAIDALETREYLQAVWVAYRTYQELERLEAELQDPAAPVTVQAD